MSSIFSYFRKRPHLLILGFILLTGLFFRTYKVIERFDFAADGDLFSWIVKDIVVNGHFRLIGQLTTAPGIFIGPFWYYLITPFMMLTNMDPIGAIIPTVIIGVLTVFSYYFVFSKLFNTKVGLIISFLYAILLNAVQLDRRVVPSTPTVLWHVWYFYSVVSLARGNYKVLPLLGVLIALIWHIHIALLPALIAIPVAMIVAKKLPNRKQLITSLAAFFITSIPLILFETRHGFQQTISIFQNFFITTKLLQAPLIKSEGATGLYKFQQVLEMITKNINNLFFSPQSFETTQNFIFILLILLSALFLVKKKLLSFKEVIVFYAWVLGVIGFFSLSSSPISEYYFANIEIIFLTIVSLLLYFLFKNSKLGKVIVIAILGIVLIKNTNFMINQYYYSKGYVARKETVDFIVKDAKEKGYPCIGISYITTPGENVGFRYFFYLKNQHLVHPSVDIPVYNIVIPDELSLREVRQKFGHIGVIPPVKIPSKEIIEKSCQTPDTNLTDSMFGYVN
ncbi:glycosyltransferase family 39 protein [Candidatus Daviesbacteria bacterium]|nr:glycosyltransferase family 39 protein [Candidatus Daviesbacteria bacterium]